MVEFIPGLRSKKTLLKLVFINDKLAKKPWPSHDDIQTNLKEAEKTFWEKQVHFNNSPNFAAKHIIALPLFYNEVLAYENIPSENSGKFSQSQGKQLENVPVIFPERRQFGPLWVGGKETPYYLFIKNLLSKWIIINYIRTTARKYI